jgi:hypothetical protein
MTTLDINLLDSYKLSQIVFADVSVYDVNPTNSSFEITVPGYDKINVVFVPRVVNIFNATHLIPNITNVSTPLPDGIYKIKYSVNPNTTTFVEKSFMRTSQIECKFYKAFLALEGSCDCNGFDNKRLKNSLRSIWLLIEGSVAASNQCDITSSYEMYHKADSLLNKLKLCNC